MRPAPVGIPKGEYLEELLAIYGITNLRSLETMAHTLVGRQTPVEAIGELLGKMRSQDVALIYKITKKLAAGEVTVVI